MPENTPGHSIPYPSPSDPIRGSTADYILTDLRDLAVGTDSAITTAVSTRAPLSHTHAVGDVTGLDARLTAIEEPQVTQISTGIYGVGERYTTPISTGIYQIGA